MSETAREQQVVRGEHRPVTAQALPYAGAEVRRRSAAFLSGADGARRSSWERECARAARFFEDLGAAKRLQPVLAHYSLARWTHDQLGFFVMLDRAIKIVDLLPWLARVS